MNEEQGEIVTARQRGRLRRPLLLATTALVVAALLAVWIERRPIAGGFIDRELGRRGVQAQYEVDQVGFRTERLVNVVIGDPARPDLTARSIEVSLGWSLSGPKVERIRARGVRLYGRLVDGRLRLGQIDRLLPPPSGAPFRLPDQYLDLADAGLRLETPYGVAAFGIEGAGKLSDGFRGRLALRSAALSPGSCRVEKLRASWAIAVDAARPQLTGPVEAERLACGGALAAGRARAELDARLEPGLDGWQGRARIDARRLDAAGNRFDRLAGALSFAGNSAGTQGKATLTGTGFASREASAREIRIDGPWSIAPASGRLLYAGDLAARGLRPSDRTVAPLRSALAGFASTPLGPIAAGWSASLTRAARSGLDLSAGLHLASEGGRGAVRLDRVQAIAGSGARFGLAGGEGLSLAWPGQRTRIDGALALSGGGLPDARFQLRSSPAGALSGVGRVAPVAAGGARLALGEIRFGPAAGGTRIETVATVDGPLGDGRVEGLVLPVRARLDRSGGFAINESCTTIAFRSLRTGSLRLGAARLPLCPTGRALVWQGRGGALSGGATLASLRLGGMLGSSPLSITAGSVRFALADRRFAASGVRVGLGSADSVNRLDIASLTGRIGSDALSGSYSGLAGKLAAVPLRVSEGKGEWRLRGADLAMEGGLTLTDAMDPPRFYPLASRDFHLSLAANRIEATGSLRDPKTDTLVATASIHHDLGSGSGRAVLDVPGIRFDPAYQPEQLTRLTVGVIALVEGVLKGEGEIAWDSAGTRSSGTFSTENMNLAASFGPVEGLSTTLQFTDLLGLVSAPGQTATVKAVRAGVDVFDGRVRYQILPDLRVRVEEGRWPFAGGDLALEDTILDFSRPSLKRLTFRVTGMDVARFIQQMEFSNIAATGTIDGVVPMIFDERGGRVEHGHLVAREGGGTLSYVGELTDRDLGTYGKLAFDALKSLRYSRLVVDLNGSLEGEFVAGIELDGIARNVAAAPASKGGLSAMVMGRALGQIAKIPFHFNITVKGPFRALIGTARSFNDPTNLIQSVLPEMLQGKPTTSKTVQPEESEPVR